MEKKYCIYIYTNKTNGKKYVGQTCQQVEARWKYRDGYKNNIYFYRAIQKYGWDNFEHQIIKNILSLEGGSHLKGQKKAGDYKWRFLTKEEIELCQV